VIDTKDWLLEKLITIGVTAATHTIIVGFTLEMIIQEVMHDWSRFIIRWLADFRRRR